MERTTRCTHRAILPDENSVLGGPQHAEYRHYIVLRQRLQRSPPEPRKTLATAGFEPPTYLSVNRVTNRCTTATSHRTSALLLWSASGDQPPSCLAPSAISAVCLLWYPKWALRVPSCCSLARTAHSLLAVRRTESARMVLRPPLAAAAGAQDARDGVTIEQSLVMLHA